MDINGESSSSSTTTSGFKLFGKTIVMSEKDVGQDHVITAAAAEEEEEEEETSMSRSSNLEEETGSAKTTTTTTKAAQHLPCPRCKSKETKFCYFNNYNVNQPRHFCKACHRYWTAGGVLRNVPVGAGRRKNRAPLPSPQGGGDSAGGAEGGGGGGGMCLVGGRGDPDPGGWKCR